MMFDSDCDFFMNLNFINCRIEQGIYTYKNLQI